MFARNLRIARSILRVARFIPQVVRFIPRVARHVRAQLRKSMHVSIEQLHLRALPAKCFTSLSYPESVVMEFRQACAATAQGKHTVYNSH